MRILLAFAALATASAAVAQPANDPTVPIKQFIDGFNKGDTKSAFAAYAKGNIQIVDEFAPHQWSGSKAAQAWAADYEKHAKATGVTEGSVSYDAPTRTEVGKTMAYIIVPTVYSYKEKGRPTVEEGQMTFVLKNGAAGWKISAWTWSGVKPHLVAK